MFSYPKKFRKLLFVACLSALTLFGASARAARFQVSPVRLELSSHASSGLLRVLNQSSEPIRFQVTAFAWNQGIDGQMQLQPTKDISFFPSMLRVKPGQSRKIRVGALVSPGRAERTYRVFIEELPPLRPPPAGSPNAIRVLTRMGIPIFLNATVPSSRPAVEALALRDGQLEFLVRNHGNTHFLNRTLRIIARDKVGRISHDRTVAGWYVLGAGSRKYDLALPKVACEDLSTITVQLDTDHGTASASLDASPEHCAR